MLTLPGRDRLASLRSLHAYDPVNTSPGLYAVPLTPFDSQTGMPISYFFPLEYKISPHTLLLIK